MFARTARLTLRPGWPEDVAALTAAIGHRGSAAMFSRVPWPCREADARAWLDRGSDHRDVALLILSHEEDYPVVVGAAGLYEDGAGGRAFACWLTPGAQGRGYATEAGHALVGMARHALGLRRLTARHASDDPAPGRVLQKLGFRRTGSGGTDPPAGSGDTSPSASYALDLAARPALARAV